MTLSTSAEPRSPLVPEEEERIPRAVAVRAGWPSKGTVRVGFADVDPSPKKPPLIKTGMPLAEPRKKHDEGNFLRAIAEAVLQFIMKKDVQDVMGAARREWTEGCTTWRNRFPAVACSALCRGGTSGSASSRIGRLPVTGPMSGWVGHALRTAKADGSSASPEKTAVAMNTDGRPEIIGLGTGPPEAEPTWSKFLRGLMAHGLDGVEIVIGDASSGLKAATGRVFDATWHRWRVHWMRNALRM